MKYGMCFYGHYDKFLCPDCRFFFVGVQVSSHLGCKPLFLCRYTGLVFLHILSLYTPHSSEQLYVKRFGDAPQEWKKARPNPNTSQLNPKTDIEPGSTDNYFLLCFPDFGYCIVTDCATNKTIKFPVEKIFYQISKPSDDKINTCFYLIYRSGIFKNPSLCE